MYTVDNKMPGIYPGIYERHTKSDAETVITVITSHPFQEIKPTHSTRHRYTVITVVATSKLCTAARCAAHGPQ